MKLQDMVKVTDRNNAMVFGMAKDGEIGFVTATTCDSCHEKTDRKSVV